MLSTLKKRQVQKGSGGVGGRGSAGGLETAVKENLDSYECLLPSVGVPLNLRDSIYMSLSDCPS